MAAKTGKAVKRTVFGGKNKLTDTVMNKLWSYFGKGIKNNIEYSVEQMRQECTIKVWSH